jgi:hypothetical protein
MSKTNNTRRQNRKINVKGRSRLLPKARGAILDGDTRRATAHIANLRRDAFASTGRRERGLLVLQFIERLSNNQPTSVSNNNNKTEWKPQYRHETGVHFHL